MKGTNAAQPHELRCAPRLNYLNIQFEPRGIIVLVYFILVALRPDPQRPFVVKGVEVRGVERYAEQLPTSYLPALVYRIRCCFPVNSSPREVQMSALKTTLLVALIFLRDRWTMAC